MHGEEMRVPAEFGRDMRAAGDQGEAQSGDEIAHGARRKEVETSSEEEIDLAESILAVLAERFSTP